MLSYFFVGGVFSFITDTSNLYALQKRGDASFKTSPKEFKCWLGMLILTSYLQVPRWQMLWEYHSESYVAADSNVKKDLFPNVKKEVK